MKHYAMTAALTLVVVWIGFQIPVIGPMLRTEAQKPPTA